MSLLISRSSAQISSSLRPSPAAPTTVPSNAQFYIHPVTNNLLQSREFDGLYLDTFHTGAGMNAVTAVSEKRLLVELNDTSLIYHVPQFPAPYTLGLDGGPPTGNTAPAGYRYISFDVTDAGTPGLELDPETGAIAYTGTVDVCSFALCNVTRISDSDDVGPDFELLFRDSSTTPNGMTCADVSLWAVYE